MEKTKLALWLENRLKLEHLSLRQAAARTNLSHATLADIINGNHPLPGTIRKLAEAFGGPCRLVLEDTLFVLAGYRTNRMKEARPYFLVVIPLLSSKHQSIVEVLVRALAKQEGIDPDSGV